MHKQSGQFTLRFDGHSIIISLATARGRCPTEVAAMESAGTQVRAARVHSNQQGIDAAQRVHEDRMRDLAQALGLQGL
jgi:hypothetical protein